MAEVIDWGEVRSAVAAQECDRETLDEIYLLTRGHEHERARLVNYLNDLGVTRWQWTLDNPEKPEAIWMAAGYHHQSINNAIEKVFGASIRNRMFQPALGTEWSVHINARLEDGSDAMHGYINIRGRRGDVARLHVSGWIPGFSGGRTFLGSQSTFTEGPSTEGHDDMNKDISQELEAFRHWSSQQYETNTFITSPGMMQALRTLNAPSARAEDMVSIRDLSAQELAMSRGQITPPGRHSSGGTKKKPRSKRRKKAARRARKKSRKR